MKKKFLIVAFFMTLSTLHCLSSTSVMNDVDKAVIEYQKKNYKNAFNLFKKAAERGDTSAMYILGLLYKEGKGTPTDIKKAFHWYEKAAKRGDTNAMNNLADQISKLGVVQSVPG